MTRYATLYRIGGTMELVGSPPVGVAGSAYSFQFSGRNGSGTYSFAASSLPAGWSFIAGLLAHAAPAAQSFQVAVTMTDTANRSNTPVQQTFTVTIE